MLLFTSRWSIPRDCPSISRPSHFMIRRSHKKSRQGCAECKRSHKKVCFQSLIVQVFPSASMALITGHQSQCDETRPSCVNCTIANRQCSYKQASRVSDSNTRRPSSQHGSRSVPEGLAGSPDESSHGHGSDPSQPGTPIPAPPRSQPYVNLLHLELFQNLITTNVPTFADEASKADWVATTNRVRILIPVVNFHAFVWQRYFAKRFLFGGISIIHIILVHI